MRSYVSPTTCAAKGYFTSKCPSCKNGEVRKDGFHCTLGKPLIDGCEPYKALVRKLEVEENKPKILF